MSPDLDPTDGLPSRAALARELLRYKMEDYSENGFFASWLIDLEFELWEAVEREAPSERVMDTFAISRECRRLAELAGGWWAWDKDVPGADNPVFMPLDKWQKLLAKRATDRPI
jgi:hypothetical protein